MIGPAELKRMRAMTRSISGSQHGAVTITKVMSSARFQVGKRPSDETDQRLRSNRFSWGPVFRDPFKPARLVVAWCRPFPFDPFSRRREASTDLARSFGFIKLCSPPSLRGLGADQNKLPPLVDFVLFRRRPPTPGPRINCSSHPELYSTPTERRW